MKFIQYIPLVCIAFIACILASCTNDGDTIYTTGGDELVLNGTTQDIILDYTQLNALAMTLYWNDNGKLSTSDERVAAPDYAITNTIQFSADDSFSSTIDFTMEEGVYQKQFTVGELNSAVDRIGLEGGISSSVYIRIQGTLASNLTPQYSNILQLKVTPYVIDMTVGHYLNSSQEDTGLGLYSANSNGIYTGFIGAGAWANWYLQEGNGVIWGNNGDSVAEFVMTSSVSGIEMWNYWYPGITGCYYTVVDTPANEWSALLLPALTVSGDISGDMEYDRKENVWRLSFTATSTGTANITISGTGKQYNVSTGTDDSSAVDTPVAFGGTSEALTFGTDATSISVTIPASGASTLELNLNNPAQWTISVVESGSTPVETVNENLYLSGIDDGLNGGNWTFDNYLVLYNEDSKLYGGACQVNSLYGYKFYTEADNWDDCYAMVDGGSAFEGSLSTDGGNITAPDAGLYVFDISLTSMTYHLYAINSVGYSGLNDDWTIYAMEATDQTGIYTSEVEKTADSPYGVKILINDNWDLAFGGEDGILRLYQDGFNEDNELDNGTYIFTVDICKGTYSYNEKQSQN